MSFLKNFKIFSKRLNRINNQRGQALVEFAIIIPILLMLIMGILQFGMMLNTYLSVENASREGARAGIVGSTDSEIQALIAAGSPNLNPQNLTITITPQQNSRQSGGTLTVSISYKYKLTVPIICSILSNQIVLKGQTSMRIE